MQLPFVCCGPAAPLVPTGVAVAEDAAFGIAEDWVPPARSHGLGGDIE